MSLFAVQLPSLPEAVQEEDKPAAEEEANEEQGEDLKVENIAVWLFLSADISSVLLLCHWLPCEISSRCIVVCVCVDDQVMIYSFCP